MAKYLADDAQAYFGYPRASEDDAERAVRAGLEVAKEVGGLETEHAGERLHPCVSIATGLVVVGELDSGGVAAAIGEAPLVATQLLALADPGTVVVSVDTRRLVGGLFDCRPVGTASDLASPAEAFQVLGETAVESRFEALGRWRGSPLIGREEELDLLVRRWEQVAQGSGRVVLIAGEPGIGKSRLARAPPESNGV